MAVSCFKVGSVSYDFAVRTAVMGIVNVTPDSFSDGGRFLRVEAAVAHGLRLADEGADFLDVGGESTRPGSDPVSIEEEAARVVPVIRELKARCGLPVSVDTTKAEVARRALEAGADWVNDISGMTFDPDMAPLVAQHGVPVVIMHTADRPKVMQATYHYQDVVGDIRRWFEERLDAAQGAGIDPQRVVLDPGIGFGKSPEHNLALIRGIGRFAELGCPVLMGPSRKSFIGAILDLPVEERLEGTLAAVAACCFYGAHVVRVHDVRACVRVCRMCDAISGKAT